MSEPTVSNAGSHYVANIVITRVDKTSAKEYGKSPVITRKASTIARVIVADEILETLMSKVAQHTAIIDDKGDIDG